MRQKGKRYIKLTTWEKSQGLTPNSEYLWTQANGVIVRLVHVGILNENVRILECRKTGNTYYLPVKDLYVELTTLETDISIMKCSWCRNPKYEEFYPDCFHCQSE